MEVSLEVKDCGDWSRIVSRCSPEGVRGGWQLLDDFIKFAFILPTANVFLLANFAAVFISRAPDLLALSGT